jgi:hypothetical protein
VSDSEAKGVIHYVAKTRDDYEDIASEQAGPVLDLDAIFKDDSNIGYTGFRHPVSTKNTPLTPAQKRRQEYVHLPAPNGLNLTWESSGFFGGRNVDGLWRELLAQWYPKSETAPAAPAKPAYDPDAVDVDLLESKLPRTPDAAMTIDEINGRFSLGGYNRTCDLLNMLDRLEFVPRMKKDFYGNYKTGIWCRPLEDPTSPDAAPPPAPAPDDLVSP